jgi:hypothetical protein
MELVYKHPDEVVPYYLNAKTHNLKFKVLVNSIKRFGFDQPIVVDENNVILKGHGRQLAALELKLEEVPVVVKTGLSDTDKKIIRISDNTIFEKTSIDVGMVDDELGSLIEGGVAGLSSFYDPNNLALLGSTEGMDLGGGVEVTTKEPPKLSTVLEMSSPHNDKKAEKPKGNLITCPKCQCVKVEE